MNKNQPYTETDVDTMRSMRKDGRSFREIAEALGRDYAAVYSKWAALKSSGKLKKPRGPNKPKPASVTPSIAAHSKPMIVLIGTPKEVTQTIQELFS